MPRFVKIPLLLFFFALCGAAIFVTRELRTRTPAPPARELFAVVNFQLSALRAADFRTAYHRSAAIVQQKFSLPQFESMVRRDFRSMTEPAQVDFGPPHVSGAAALVEVFLTLPDGSVQPFIYSFSAERDAWKIDGVQSLGKDPRLPGLAI